MKKCKDCNNYSKEKRFYIVYSNFCDICKKSVKQNDGGNCPYFRIKTEK